MFIMIKVNPKMAINNESMLIEFGLNLKTLNNTGKIKFAIGL